MHRDVPNCRHSRYSINSEGHFEEAVNPGEHVVESKAIQRYN